MSEESGLISINAKLESKVNMAFVDASSFMLVENDENSSVRLNMGTPRIRLNMRIACNDSS
jgi:hypothetical protein